MNLAPTIAEHGSAVLSVACEHPHDNSWSYTIGRHRRGGPELLLFLEDRQLAGAILNEFTPKDGPLPSLTPGSPRPISALDGHRVDFRRARLPWAHMKCIVAFEEQGVDDPAGIDVLQVVMPDSHGNLPGEGDRPLECHCCPDTSRDDGWLYALPVPILDMRWCDGHGPHSDDPDGLLVAAPIWADGGAFIGREELVPVRRLDEATVEVLAPPVLADWTTTGAVHRLEPGRSRSGHPMLGPEISASPGVHLCWSLDADGESPDSAATWDWLLDHKRLAVTVAPYWLSVTASPRDAKQVRSRMRRLERDGDATAMPRFSEPLPAGTCTCPGCTNGIL